MFQSIQIVLKEVWNNRYRLLRLAKYELKTQNAGTMLGSVWNLLNPALQIFTYWFVFAVGLRQGNNVGDYPYIIWMIAGLVPWFYISAALTSANTCIFSYAAIIKRMKFPLAIVPFKTVLAQFISNIYAMIVTIVILLIYGVPFSWRNLQLLYFMFASVAFLVSFALIFSAVTVLFKDFSKFFSSFIRLLFYISPVVWDTSKLPQNVLFIIKLNPLYYLLEGYRESLLNPQGLTYHWAQMLYFWAVTLLMFMVGCSVHMKFRKKFIDLI